MKLGAGTDRKLSTCISSVFVVSQPCQNNVTPPCQNNVTTMSKQCHRQCLPKLQSVCFTVQTFGREDTKRERRNVGSCQIVVAEEDRISFVV